MDLLRIITWIYIAANFILLCDLLLVLLERKIPAWTGITYLILTLGCCLVLGGYYLTAPNKPVEIPASFLIAAGAGLCLLNSVRAKKPLNEWWPILNATTALTALTYLLIYVYAGGAV